MNDRTILMNAAGSPCGPAFISLAHRAGYEIAAADIDDRCPAAWLADAYVRDARFDEPGYGDKHLRTAASLGARWVVPNGGVRELAAASPIDGVTLVAPDLDTVTVCQDKALLYEALAPDLAPVFGVETSIAAIARAYQRHGEGNLTVKPRHGEGSRGFYRLVDELSAADLLDGRLRTKVVADDLFRAYGVAAVRADAVVWTEYLPGPEITIVACVDGDHLDLLPFERLSVQPDGFSTTNRLRSRSVVEPLFRTLRNRLHGLNGYVDVQIKQHADGSWRVVDLNPRLSGLVAACTALGLPQPDHPAHTFPHLLPQHPGGEVVLSMYNKPVLAGGRVDL